MREIQLFRKSKPLPITIKFAIGLNGSSVILQSSYPDLLSLLDSDTLEYVGGVPKNPGVYKAYLVITTYQSNNYDDPLEYDSNFDLIKVIKMKVRK